MHYSVHFKLFSVLYSVPTRLPACLPEFFFKKMSSPLLMIRDSPTKEFEAGYITCPDS